MAKVSVIIPVYNNEKYIEKCIDSVRRQSYMDLEIIVINDGSEDRSEAILNSVKQEDPRMILIHQQNLGVSAARNRGIEIATGEYITFLDGDDYLGKDYIMSLVQCAEKSHADMVLCGYKMVTENGRVVKEIVPSEYIKGQKEEWVFRISVIWSHLYKRELWGQYDVRFRSGVRGEDVPVSLFFSAVCNKIVTYSGSDYYYVQHSDSASHNFQGLKTYRLPYEPLEEVIRKVQDLGIKNSKEYYELFVIRIFATFINLARGAERYEIKRLEEYIVRILETYFPNYYSNSKIKLTSKLEVPFTQKLAVLVLVQAVHWNKLSLLLRIVC